MVEDFVKEAARIVPSPRQLAWQQMEFYGFVHFGLNTFTGKEWGSGKVDPALFNPVSLDTGQWVKALKSAGMTGVIATAKHHDGFCLWQTETTAYGVASSPWKGGRGDVLAELAESCRREGLKLGVYLSPWDRHESLYGSKEYNRFFLRQLKELLTGYGPLFCVWFDGACGEGPNGKKQVYDWPSYYALIRELQPQAVISIVGPDVRWCGNEAGHCRESEWSVVPAAQREADAIAEKSQQEDDGKFAMKFNATDDDLGSREKIRHAEKLIWYPSETDTSIRPNWFWRRSDNRKVKSLRVLFNLYCRSVGGNSVLLLNVPPNRYGLIEDIDVRRLSELGDAIGELYRDNFALDTDLDPDRKGRIAIPLDSNRSVNTLILQEDISRGQRVESFLLEGRTASGWKQVYRGTIIGHKRICRFKKIKTGELRLTITASRDDPHLKSLQVTFFDRIGGLGPAERLRMELHRLGDRIYMWWMSRRNKTNING